VLGMATDLDDEKGAAFLNTALAPWSLRIRPPRPGKSGLDAPPPSEPSTVPPVPGLIDFDDFFRSSFPVVRRAVWAITQDWALADDVAQAAMMAALNSWDVVAEHPEPRGWVIVTARNIAFRVMRKIRKARPDSPAVDRHVPDPAPAGLDPTGETISRLDLMEALRRLPQRQRECVFLVYFLGYRIKDAASMMGIAEGTVKTLLHTARGALRGLLSFDEGDIR